MPLARPMQVADCAPPVGVVHAVRTKFCTSTGWHRYDAVTPAMREVILSASDGVGRVRYPKSRRTEDALLAMGLVEPTSLERDRKGMFSGFRLTHHGEVAWLELDAPAGHEPLDH